MGIRARALGLLVVMGLLSASLGGCFGYNKSAKRWAYVGDTLLVLGGGGAIALDLTNKPAACMETDAMHCQYHSPIGGMLVTGVVLAGAGLFGMIFNATRSNVRSSR